MHPLHIRLADAPLVRLPGNEGVRPLLRSRDTDDRFSLTHYNAAPRIGPPLHRHTREDEMFYILDGEVVFRVGDQTITARAGDTVFGPRGVAHAFKNLTDAPAHMLLLVTPAANFEKFYAAITAPMPGGSVPSEEDFKMRTVEHGPGAGIEIIGPNPL